MEGSILKNVYYCLQIILNPMNSEGPKVLIVDDETDILEIIRYNLRREGFLTEVATNGEEGLLKAKEFLPDLILLDIMMPGKNGFEMLIELRKQSRFKNTAVLFLSALGNERAQVQGLNIGADDYIVKPIKPRLLLSRIQAVLRRTSKDINADCIRVGSLVIDRTRFMVGYKNKTFHLAKKEFELLELFALHPGRVFLRDEILREVWGTAVIVGDRTIDVHVRKIRKKMQADIIKTVKGVGYKLEV